MNEKFTKTLETLEAAENEMIELHNTLDGLEIHNRASWHEVQAVAGYRENLKSMQASIRAMLGKREDKILRGLHAEQYAQADLLPCGHSSDNLGNFGGCNPMGSCVICDASAPHKTDTTLTCPSCKATYVKTRKAPYCNSCGAYIPGQVREP